MLKLLNLVKGIAPITGYGHHTTVSATKKESCRIRSSGIILHPDKNSGCQTIICET